MASTQVTDIIAHTNGTITRAWMSRFENMCTCDNGE